jgi:hypothetical protein
LILGLTLKAKNYAPSAEQVKADKAYDAMVQALKDAPSSIDNQLRMVWKQHFEPEPNYKVTKDGGFKNHFNGEGKDRRT